MGIIQRLFGKKKETSLESKVAEPMVPVQSETASLETVTQPKATISKILVIEDTPKHLADAKAYFADKPIEVVYASTYEEATKLYDSVDAVISDVYFPESEGKEPMDMGVEVALDLYGKKPFVLCTSGYHHGSKLQHVCTLARAYGWILVDGIFVAREDDHKLTAEDKQIAYNERDREIKAWDEAYTQLLGGGLQRYEIIKSGELDSCYKSFFEEIARSKVSLAKRIMELPPAMLLLLSMGQSPHLPPDSKYRTPLELVKHPKLFKVLEKGEDGMYTKVELV